MSAGQRRLAALMVTDRVGYAALTQIDEARALRLLEAHRRLLRPMNHKPQSLGRHAIAQEIASPPDPLRVLNSSLRCNHHSRFVNKLTRVAPIQLPRFFYTGVHVSDLERAIKFYTKQLRMKLLFKARIKETGGRVAWLKSKGSSQLLELNWYPKGYKYGGKSGLDHLAFKVKDVHSLYKQITKKHSRALEPFSEGRWKLAYVKDPDGNWIELGELVRKRKRRA